MMGMSLPALYYSLFCIVSGIERVRVRREMGNGMYTPLMYLVVTTSILLPLSLCYGAVSALFIYSWGVIPWASYGYTLLANGLATFWFASIAQLTGWLFGMIAGPMVYVLFWSLSFGARRSPVISRDVHLPRRAAARCALPPFRCCPPLPTDAPIPLAPIPPTTTIAVDLVSPSPPEDMRPAALVSIPPPPPSPPATPPDPPYISD